MNLPKSGLTSGSRWLVWAQVLWLLVLPVLVLGPALTAPGQLLSYDMVWVPQLSMRPSFLGLGSGWPRAVPSDAVVALLDNVIPALFLPRLVLYGALALAGLGVTRLLAGPASERRASPDVVAATAGATCYVWNPFIAERLVIGHWPVLLGYAALPWVLVAARRIRGSRAGWGSLAGWLWLGSLSASAGLVTGVVALLALWRRRAWQGNLGLVVMLAAANSVWIFSGLLHWSLPSDPSGFRAFAAHGEGGLPTPLATLALGGIWNQDVVPGSRTSLLVWVSLLLLQVPMALILRSWWRATESWLRRTLLVGAAGGWFIAILGWLVPDVLGNLASALPPVSLLRDGTRYLAVMALLQAVLLSSATSWLLVRIKEWRVGIAMIAITLPILLLPDLAWGAFGVLRPTHYPQSFAQARAVLSDRLDRVTDKTLILPFYSYRAPSWNRQHPVLDPMGRYLTQEYVVNDALQVSGKPIPGEDPLAAKVAVVLARPDPEQRAAGLGELGIRAVVTERHTGLPTEEISGVTVLDTPDIAVQLLEPSRSVAKGALSPFLLTLLWACWFSFAALALAAALLGIRSWIRRLLRFVR